MATQKARRAKLDRKGRRARWLQARNAERLYGSRLLQVARKVKALIGLLSPDASDSAFETLIRTLTWYADTIKPWATSVATYMLADVDRKNAAAWRAHGEEIGMELRRTIRDTPVGMAYRELLAENVHLIQSIPLEAAEGVSKAVQENLYSSTRSTELAKSLAEQENIPQWRAKLIARTETSRASTTLTQVRAQAIGSEGYIWRTVDDSDVRPTHKAMNGRFVRWDSPPKTDKGLEPYHAGCGPNCRCYPEPVLPEF